MEAAHTPELHNFKNSSEKPRESHVDIHIDGTGEADLEAGGDGGECTFPPRGMFEV